VVTGPRGAEIAHRANAAAVFGQAGRHEDNDRINGHGLVRLRGTIRWPKAA